MKTLSIYEPMSREYFDFWTSKYKNIFPDYADHPREDYHLVSEKYFIFVVADGVTLKRDKDGNYPNPSGAGELAKIFCETVLREAEKRYENFKESDLGDLFSLGNKAAEEYNISKGRIKSELNYRELDFFATTTAFALMKDSKLYWWSLSDAGVVILDKEGKQTFHSPEAWTTKEKDLPPRGDTTETDWNKMIKREYRNTVAENGCIKGYGAVTGEENVLKYLNVGSVNISFGDTILVYTDGFENYLSLSESVGLFCDWKIDIEEKLKILSAEKTKTSPILFGQERSLIVVKV